MPVWRDPDNQVLKHEEDEQVGIAIVSRVRGARAADRVGMRNRRRLSC